MLDITPVSERINGRLLLGGVTDARELSTEVHRVKASQILNAARVDWTVSKRALRLPDGRAMPGAFALVRDDNGAPLSVVGSQYQPNQNVLGLSAFDRLVEAGLLEGYSNAGVFAGGKLAWIQAQMRTFDIGGDEMRGYLTLTISHGSRMTDRWNPSTTRIVCRNTFMMSRAAANGGLTMGHTRKGNLEFEGAVERIHAAVDMLERFRERGQRMYHAQMTASGMRAFAEELFPSDVAKPSPRLEGMRERVIDLFETGRGNYAVRGTRWAAFNAVTEYADHYRSTRRTGDDSAEDSRLASAWFGSGAALKERALALLAS